jgi:hypothetical protein
VIPPFFAYTGIVPTARSCSVSFTDSEGITHSVEITASTLFEAAVVAMAEFRRHGFADTTFGSADNAERSGEGTRGFAFGLDREGQGVVGSGRQESPRTGGEEPVEVFAVAVNGIVKPRLGSMGSGRVTAE